MATPATTTIQRSGRKLLVHTVLSLLTIVLGVALLVYMITVEDEPGALPLAMIVVGIGWYFIARARLKPRAARGASGH